MSDSDIDTSSHCWCTLTAILILTMLISACSKPRAELIHHTIEHDDILRDYYVHLPNHDNSGNSGESLKLVVALHGYTSTASGFAAYHGLNRHADEHNYIVVYPQGTHFADPASSDRGQVTSWNDLAANLGPRDAGPHCAVESVQYPCPPDCGSCNRCAWTTCADDVGFISKLLDEVEATYNTARGSAYLLGVSNGGMMTWRLGCNLSDRFAAIAPIIGQLAPGYACGPQADTPVIHLFGGEDSTVRFDGSSGADGFRYTSAADSARVWAESMRCESGPLPWHNEYSTSAGLQCTAYSDCRMAGQEVVSCLDPEGAHDWPAQRIYRVSSATCVTEEQIDAMPSQTKCEPSDGKYVAAGMDLIWSFFQRYPVNQ